MLSRKILPYVVLGVSAIFSCKNTGIDYSMLDDDGDAISGAVGWVDLQVVAPTSAIGKGRVLLRLSEHLWQDSNVRGVDLSFVANGTLNFGAPDANNEATPDDADISISMIKLNLVNSVDEHVCPDDPVVAHELVPDDSEDIIFTATDLACSGNKLVGMSALASGIDDLTEVPSHVWYHKYEEDLNKVDKFYQEEKQKGEQGALHKTQDPAINAVIDDFLIRRKMLKGYSAMRTELEKHAPLAEMKSQVQTNAKDSNKHVVIPATLNAFLDVRVNNRVIPDDSTGQGGNIDMLLLQGAMGNAVVKFLQYDHLFQFADGETRGKFQQIKSQLPSEIRTRIEEIQKNFTELSSGGKVYNSASEVYGPLNNRLTCMNTFLTQQEGAGEPCEDILPGFYSGLTSLSCGDKEAEDGDVFMLLTSRKVMEATKLYDVCKEYNIELDKFNKENIKIIEAGVADMKASAIESMEDLLKIRGEEDFRAKLLQNHFYAAVPVITEHPDKAGELAAAMKAAHEDIYKKRKSDETWQKRLGWVNAVAVAAGIASVALIWFPPAAGVVSIAAAVAAGAGALLFVGYAQDWRLEKGDYAALEKAIYSGGQGDVAGLADTMQEWKAAKRQAIWEGVFTAVAFGGAGRLITDPRAVATRFSGKNLGGSLKASWKKGMPWTRWKSWRETRRATKEANKTIKGTKEWSKTEEGMWEISAAKVDVANAKAEVNNLEKGLRSIDEKISLKGDNPSDTTEGIDLINQKLDTASLLNEADDVLRKAQADLDQLIPSSKGIFRKLGDGIVDTRRRFLSFRKKEITGGVETLKEADGWFKRSGKKILETKRFVYGLNREGRKAAEFTIEMKDFAKQVRQANVKMRWKLVRGKDRKAVIEIGDGGKITKNAEGNTVVKIGKKEVSLPRNVAEADDFKLGAEGYWVAVLTAEKLDRLWGGKGKRFIEGRVPLIGDRMFE